MYACVILSCVDLVGVGYWRFQSSRYNRKLWYRQTTNLHYTYIVLLLFFFFNFNSLSQNMCVHVHDMQLVVGHEHSKKTQWIFKKLVDIYFKFIGIGAVVYFFSRSSSPNDFDMGKLSCEKQMNFETNNNKNNSNGTYTHIFRVKIWNAIVSYFYYEIRRKWSKNTEKKKLECVYLMLQSQILSSYSLFCIIWPLNLVSVKTMISLFLWYFPSPKKQIVHPSVTKYFCAY